MTTTDDILDELKLSHQPALTAADLAALISNRRHGRPRRIRDGLRRLVARGRIEKLGNGGPDDPYTYRLKSI
jgi:hypothetical protein